MTSQFGDFLAGNYQAVVARASMKRRNAGYAFHYRLCDGAWVVSGIYAGFREPPWLPSACQLPTDTIDDFWVVADGLCLCCSLLLCHLNCLCSQVGFMSFRTFSLIVEKPNVEVIAITFAGVGR